MICSVPNKLGACIFICVHARSERRPYSTLLVLLSLWSYVMYWDRFCCQSDETFTRKYLWDRFNSCLERFERVSGTGSWVRVGRLRVLGYRNNILWCFVDAMLYHHCTLHVFWSPISVPGVSCVLKHLPASRHNFYSIQLVAQLQSS